MAKNSSVRHKPPCILDSQLLAGKVGTKARDSSPFLKHAKSINPGILFI